MAPPASRAPGVARALDDRVTARPIVGCVPMVRMRLDGVLRVLDGQHRLLALHALAQAGDTLASTCPRCCSTRLDARQIVELFVAINAKHTRLANTPSRQRPRSARSFVALDVMARARELGRDPFDLHGIREAIRPWEERLGDRRFEAILSPFGVRPPPG